jgi:sugar phosphate isomerase/epimerase
MMARHGWAAVSSILLLMSTAAPGNDSGEQRQLILTGDYLSAWRGDTGQWAVIGNARLKPSDAEFLTTEPGTGAIFNGPLGKTVNLLSKREFGDVRAHIEFMVSKDSNSGVYFMGRYELQVFDSWGKTPEYPGIECGGIYERWDENRPSGTKGFEGRSARVNASREPGQWQTFDAIFRAPRFDKAGRKIANARFEKVTHNGVVVHRDVEVTGPTRSSAYDDEKPVGPLMLQGDHGPVAYRNIRLAPAGPNPFFAMDTATKDDNHKTASQQVQMLKEFGYAGISAGYETPESLAETLKELDARDLQLFAVYAGIDVDPGERPYDPSLVDAMKVLEGRNTILWLFAESRTQKPSASAGDRRAVEIIRELADTAATHTVRIALYPHQGFWLETIDDAMRIAEKVDRRNVGVTFNLCHWLRTSGGGDAEPVLQRAMPRLFAVTINGADTGGRDWKTLIQPLDRGTFDVRGFLATLRDVGYTGPVGFQGYGIGGDARENLRRTMAAWAEYSQVLCEDAAVFGEPKKTQ